MIARAPELAVILVTPGRGATLRPTVRHLQAQTVCDRIELVLVGPHDDSFADLEPPALAGFARVQIVAVGPIRVAERALAHGVGYSNAPLVAPLENHVFPAPGWAEAILEAHRGPWAAVGSTISNANPASTTSWIEHLLSYGFHDEPAGGSEQAQVSRNNLTYKRSVLAAFGDRLPDAFARDGGLLEELHRQGHRFYRQRDARMQHLNVSRLAPMLVLRVLSARASAARRARTGGWPGPKRLLYVLGSPAFPLLRLRALWPVVRSLPPPSGLMRTAPLLTLALVLDGLGQALGFAFGAGKSAEHAGHYDLARLDYVSDADRACFAE